VALLSLELARPASLVSATVSPNSNFASVRAVLFRPHFLGHPSTRYQSLRCAGCAPEGLTPRLSRAEFSYGDSLDLSHLPFLVFGFSIESHFFCAEQNPCADALMGT